MTIQMFSKDNCRQCDFSERKLKEKGVEYTKTNMVEDEAALAYVKGLGYMQAPVLVVQDENGEVIKHWSGFRPDEIEALVQAA